MKRYTLGQVLWIGINSWVVGVVSCNLWHDRHDLTWGMFWPVLMVAVVVTLIAVLIAWRRSPSPHR